jgi:hypothetical protein
VNDRSVTTTSDVKAILYPAAESPEYDISVKVVMQTTSYGIQPENANWWVRIKLVRYQGGSCATNTKREFGEIKCQVKDLIKGLQEAIMNIRIG